MTFLHPEFLYYMLPPLFILFALLLTQKDAQAQFFSEEVMQKLRTNANTLTLQARNALFFIIGFLIIVALAQPVIKDGTVDIKQKSADIMVALDISNSMLAQDVYPNRLLLAKKKAKDFITKIDGDRVGVMAFAKNSYLVSPLSFDVGAVEFLLAKLDTNSITQQGTSIMTLLESFNKQSQKETQKYLLIFTDGGDKKEFSSEIAYAKKHKITVFIVAMGSTKGAPVKDAKGEFIKQNGEIIISKLNQNISALATQTGGYYVQNTTSDEDINFMLKEIKKYTTKKELKNQKIQKYIPLFYYPVGLALFILLFATSSMSKRESVYVPALLFIMLFSPTISKAGVLDFLELDKAKQSYENKDYKTASKIYKDYVQKTDNSQAHYDLANSLYKQKKYDEAVNEYKNSFFKNKDEKASKYGNLGNAYAQKQDIKSLKEAIKSYEKSLSFKEDKDVRENLETVKKLLKQKQKKQEQKKKKQDKKKKQNKKQKNKNKDQNKKDSGKKGQNKKKNENQNNGKKKSEEKKKQQQNNKQDKKQQQQKKKDEKKGKNKKDEKNKTSSKQSMQKAQPKKMSDKEMKKWLKKLEKKQSSFLYRLNKTKPTQESEDEKPW